MERWAGADRYATAAAVSSHTFPAGGSDVFVATGTTFPDALSATAAAGKAGAPILITAPTALPTVIKTELTRLKPQRITVVGGTSAVSAAVATDLAHYTSGQVRRLAGSDRFQTSAAISQATFTTVTRALLATGLGFPDALSGGPVAGRDGAPVLLVDKTCVPTVIGTELNRLTPARATILGGVAAVGAPVDALAPCSSYTPPPPPAPANVKITKVQYDSPGSDTGSNSSLNAEFVVLANTGKGSAAMAGWTLRDAQSHVYTFPTFTLPAGGQVTIHTGTGTNTATNLYWGSGAYIWNNTGDTAYLRNSAGTLVDSCTWTSLGSGSTTC